MLPGIGSYIALAIQQRDMLAIGSAILAVFIAILIGAALDRYYGNDLRQTFYLRFQATLNAALSAGLLYAAVVGAILYLRAQQVALANRRALVRETGEGRAATVDRDASAPAAGAN